MNDLCRVFCLGLRAVGKLLFKHFAHKRDAGHVLSQAVVQILADARLFASADIQHRILDGNSTFGWRESRVWT